MSVMDVVTISSPGSGSMAAMAQCTAADPDEQAKACFAPTLTANSVSSRLLNCPLVAVRVPLRMASVSRAISSSPRVRPDASWSEGRATAGGCATGMFIGAKAEEQVQDGRYVRGWRRSGR